tara:strand:- start:23830 stop:24504 length:675 start_codon:yes stop_codon:yes gene_type:complete
VSLILASASSARRKLLENAYIAHHIAVSGLNEDDFNNPDPNILAELLAKAKAFSVSQKLKKGSFDTKKYSSDLAILGCDSIFVFRDQIYGKPNTQKAAIDRLKSLSSSRGYLLTGHALYIRNNLPGKENYWNLFSSGVISTEIHFTNPGDDEIQKYVLTNEPMKCAGGFSIDGKGAKFIKSIDGCYTNVLGLSLPWLYDTQKKSKIVFLKHINDKKKALTESKG